MHVTHHHSYFHSSSMKWALRQSESSEGLSSLSKVMQVRERMETQTGPDCRDPSPLGLVGVCRLLNGPLAVGAWPVEHTQQAPGETSPTAWGEADLLQKSDRKGPRPLLMSPSGGQGTPGSLLRASAVEGSLPTPPPFLSIVSEPGFLAPSSCSLVSFRSFNPGYNRLLPACW